MFDHIDIDSKIAVYKQIEDEVILAIASGELKTNDQILSTIALSNQIGVNFNTVSKAYRNLKVMGLVYTRHGMGNFVQKGVRARCRKICVKKLKAQIHEVTQTSIALGMLKGEFDDLVKKARAS